MQDEFIAVGPDRTVGRTIDDLRETPDLPDRFWEIYVVDAEQRLIGAVSLDRLLRTKRPVAVPDCSRRTRARCAPPMTRREVARLFERYDLVSAPVVDDGDRLVRVITFDDIVDVIEEEAKKDIRRLAA